MRKWLSALALGCALTVSSGAWAAEEEAAPNTGALSLAAGVDYVTAYWFRGANLEDTGLILQPWANLYVKAYESDELTVTPYIGTWNSFQEVSPGADGTNDAWFESDLYGAVDIGFGNFTLSPIYTFYTSPANAFATIEEFGVKLAYDDAQLMEKAGIPFALSPYVAWYVETDDDAGEENQYAEVGATPGFDIPDTSVSLSFPLALGMSTDGLYTDDDGSTELLGYGSVGAYATVPLPIPTKFGSWSLTAGVTYLYLFADSLEALNKDDSSGLFGKVGISFTY